MQELNPKTLLNRLFIAAILALLVLATNYMGAYIWASLVLVVALIALREFRRLCYSSGVHPSGFWIRTLVVVFILIPVYLKPSSIFVCQGFLIALSFTIVLLRLLLRSHKTHFNDVAASLWSIVYLGFLPSFYIWIRGLEHGFEFIIILIATVSIGDAAAMFAGKLFGKTPLSPQISPNKTIEGSVAGLVFATIAFYFLIKYFGLELNYEMIYRVIPVIKNDAMIIAILGLAVAFISQIGDLLESLFKRDAGVKDSGTLLESHGGMLDRVDSHLFSAWIGYFIFYYLLG